MRCKSASTGLPKLFNSLAGLSSMDSQVASEPTEQSHESQFEYLHSREREQLDHGSVNVPPALPRNGTFRWICRRSLPTPRWVSPSTSPILCYSRAGRNSMTYK